MTTTPNTTQNTNQNTSQNAAKGLGGAWGVELVIDLDGCDRALISDGETIRRFAADVVDAIGMQAYGDPVIERFALHDPDAAGYSLMQLITTSSITAHFAENTGRAFVNVFSCKDFDTDTATAFIVEYFQARHCTALVLHRGAPGSIVAGTKATRSARSGRDAA